MTGDRIESRDDDHGTRIGQAIRASRLESGWSQRELARRMDVAQSSIARLEAGHSRHVDVRVASAALDLLGIRVSLDGRTIGLANRRYQRDAVHARCAEYARRRLEVAGWSTALEVEIGHGRGRGWIDLLGFRAVDRALLVVEIKTEIRDVGEILRTIGWYERSAWTSARAFAWRPIRTSVLLLTLDSVENDARLRAHSSLIGSEFPTRADVAGEWLRKPEARAIRGIALIDPRSRRSTWLRPMRGIGRRSPSAYLDYADAALALVRPRGASERPRR